ncbi:hypothetical protein GCM10007041_29240 [Butyricimonas faecihominis]|nr:hypothetical protein Bfae18676_22860 [Butyricimonas faecihominis]GGJ38020.1 hypothetical protein GCM10007041_29240 [Butyricimonas faecihominis]
MQVTSSQVTSLNHLQPEESKIQPVTYYVCAQFSISNFQFSINYDSLYNPREINFRANRKNLN